MLQVSASASGGPGRLRGTYLLGASECPPRFSPPPPQLAPPSSTITSLLEALRRDCRLLVIAVVVLLLPQVRRPLRRAQG